MLKLSEFDIIERIQRGELFECQSLDSSFSLKIETYTPAVCLAIHAGHTMRSSIINNCRLDDQERLYEEDPYTEKFVHAMPITLVANDSRYEYDLNRPVANCIYNTAWGKNVWRKKNSPKEQKKSIEKHQSFYRVLDILVDYLENRFSAVVLFDIHSYNYLRREDKSPVFNLGTEQINKERWQGVVDVVLKILNRIELPNIPVNALENSSFYGRGYLIAHINSRFQNSLVLPIEIKKIFMDEIKGEPFPLVMQELNHQFKDFLVDVSALFSRRYTSNKIVKSSDVLTEKMDPAILAVDRSLYHLAKGLETLHYINPINILSERKKFFKSNGKALPEFRYRQLDLDPYVFREKLYRLPVNTIRDPAIQSLYRDVIDSLSEKIGMLVKSGQSDFVYESLKYYGEPSLIDENNAQFLLHANMLDTNVDRVVDTEELITRFREHAVTWGMNCKIEISTKLVASAMVSNSRKMVLIAKNLQLTEVAANALIHHELGVHMATTLNSSAQRLKVFSLGLPGNTLTQEGLAILNEYHSGNMTLSRLQGLALRVMAVKKMLKYNDFRHTYSYLHEEHKLSPDNAFKLSLRVHRGGGFTKDYLYLNGVSQALNLYQKEDLINLYVGKTGLKYLPIVNEMVERQLVFTPKFYPSFLANPHKNSTVLDFLISNIK